MYNSIIESDHLASPVATIRKNTLQARPKKVARMNRMKGSRDRNNRLARGENNTEDRRRTLEPMMGKRKKYGNGVDCNCSTSSVTQTLPKQ